MASNKERERDADVGSEEVGSGVTDSTAGSGGVFGGGDGPRGGMGGGGGFGGSTGAGLGGTRGAVPTALDDATTSERGAGTGGPITNSIKDRETGD
jgi:hypothetical protein